MHHPSPPQNSQNGPAPLCVDNQVFLEIRGSNHARHFATSLQVALEQMDHEPIRRAARKCRDKAAQCQLPPAADFETTARIRHNSPHKTCLASRKCNRARCKPVMISSLGNADTQRVPAVSREIEIRALLSLSTKEQVALSGQLMSQREVAHVKHAVECRLEDQSVTKRFAFLEQLVEAE